MSDVRVITGKNTRWSYCHVWEPKSINGSEPKYSISLIIPKSDKKTLGAIDKAIEAAYIEGEGRLRGNGRSVPPLASIRTPLRDGDAEKPDDSAYAGCFFLNANAKNQPGIVDSACNPIIDQSEVYSGCYGRASITFFAYNANGNKGIACGLNNLQKCSDGNPLDGRISAENEFAEFNGDDEFLD